MSNIRIAYFDIAKFVAMMMVILGHFGVPDINRFVFSFHVPLFFLISGYFFKPNKNTWSLVKLKARQLLIPYIFVMFSVIFIYIVDAAIKGISVNTITNGVVSYLIGYAYGSGYIDNVCGHSIQIVGPIWFCLALFFDFIWLNLILKTKRPFVWTIVVFTIGYISSKYIWLPLSLQSSFTALLFFYSGYLANKYNIFWKNYSLPHVFPLLCIWGIGLSYGSQFLIVQNEAVFLLSDIIVALAACYLVILYCKWYEKEFKSAQIMAFLGKYTIVMLCLHSIDVNIMPWNEYFKTPNTSGNIILLKILITFIKFLFPIFGAIIVSKSTTLKKLFALKY